MRAPFRRFYPSAGGVVKNGERTYSEASQPTRYMLGSIHNLLGENVMFADENNDIEQPRDEEPVEEGIAGEDDATLVLSSRAELDERMETGDAADDEAEEAAEEWETVEMAQPPPVAPEPGDREPVLDIEVGEGAGAVVESVVEAEPEPEAEPEITPDAAVTIPAAMQSLSESDVEPAPEPAGTDDEGWVEPGVAAPPESVGEPESAGKPEPAGEPAPAAEAGFVSAPEPSASPAQPAAAQPTAQPAAATAGGASTEAAPSAPPGKNAFGPVGDLLEKIGITNYKTQQWVTIGVGAALVLCCACVCVVAAVSFFSQ